MPVYGTLFKPLQKTDENLVMKWLMCLHRSEKHKKTSVNSMTYRASDTGLSGQFPLPTGLQRYFFPQQEANPCEQQDLEIGI